MQFPDSRILIFAKAPEPGRVKTRLIPLLGAGGAARLQQRLLETTVARVAGAGLCPVTLCCAPDTGHPQFSALAGRHDITLRPQCAGDLGQRMAEAAAAALGETDQVLLIGTDCPVMQTAYLADALAQLAAGKEAVIGPAEDGGYVLLGLRRFYPLLFTDMPWGSDEVLGLTRQRLAGLAADTALLPPLWDLDRPADWQRLLRHDPRWGAVAGGRAD